MNESDWSEQAASNAEFSSLWDAPPDLGSCDLFYVQVDERKSSVTAGFDAPRIIVEDEGPKSSPNSVEFYLEFTGVEKVRVHGWQAPGNKDVRLHTDSSGTVHFRAESDGSRLEFTASAWSLVGFRARRVSR